MRIIKLRSGNTGLVLEGEKPPYILIADWSSEFIIYTRCLLFNGTYVDNQNFGNYPTFQTSLVIVIDRISVYVNEDGSVLV